VRRAVERGDSAPSYSLSPDTGGSAESATARSSQQPTSSHDAPLRTSESEDAQ
jgi:hypothetical protein